ncbi:hypothetical protein tb265_06770 [Gemmatimonadetes bacterium T265]|nr:hypothetical protein tb265_06770 [Gemmatimonadetes bacterium T265]
MMASRSETHRISRVVALVCGVAVPAPALAHGGLPVRLVADRPAGPYAVSVWARADVGMGMVYVVYRARDGAAFVAPAAVRVGVVPASGARAEVLYDAHPEAVRAGARFVAHVAFDRAEPWRVRVVTDAPTPAGGAVDDVRAQADVAPATLGPFGTLLYAAPFALVGGLWWRVAASRRQAARRRAAGPRPSLAPA